MSKKKQQTQPLLSGGTLTTVGNTFTVSAGTYSISSGSWGGELYYNFNGTPNGIVLTLDGNKGVIWDGEFHNEETVEYRKYTNPLMKKLEGIK